MKKIILDHCRRWWWILALGAAYALILGWSLALPTDGGDSACGQKTAGLALFLWVWVKVQSNLFVMQIFCLATFTGAIWLLLDLQRGVARVVATLPLTARQIGRSWWLATVAVPASAFAALFFAGAAIYFFLHEHAIFPLARLGLAGVIVWIWLGTSFHTYFGQFTTPQSGSGDWRKRMSSLAVTALSIWMIFGFAFSTNAQHRPGQLAIFLCGGALLTVLGWRRANQFQIGHPHPPVAARSRRGLTPLAPRVLLTPKGQGGILFLIRTHFLSPFLTCVALAVWMPLAMHWFGAMDSWTDAFAFIGGMGAAFWLIIFSFVSPVLRQLRWLRTLPISTTKLTATLFALTHLPLVAFATLLTLLATLVGGIPLAVKIAEGYVLVLGLASACLSFAIWFGVGAPTYLVFLTVWVGAGIPSYLMVFIKHVSQKTAAHPSFTLPFEVALAVGGTLLMFLLTRLVLRRSSRAYRIQTTVFNKDPWGAAR